MKKIFTNYLWKVSCLLAFSIISNNAAAQCNPKPLIKQHKSDFKPYRLDSYTESIVSFDKKHKSTDVQFTAYAGELYRLLFCGNNLPQEVEFSIYDKNPKSKSRVEVYKGTIKQGNSATGPFLPSKPGTYFITYNIPESVDTTEIIKGCIVTLIGYKEKEE